LLLIELLSISEGLPRASNTYANEISDDRYVLELPSTCKRRYWPRGTVRYACSLTFLPVGGLTNMNRHFSLRTVVGSY
jgi:hypothetical protein